jgi:type IV pilus assembly protein PilC
VVSVTNNILFLNSGIQLHYKCEVVSMQFYKYKAINKEGVNVEGELASVTEDELITRLREQDLTVIDIKEVTVEQPKDVLTKEINLNLEVGVSKKKLAFFARQLAITLNAGIPLSRIFTTLIYQTSSKNLRKILHRIGTDIQLGESLSDAMNKHKGVFDNLFLSMVTLGEASGTLPQTMSKLASLMEKDLALKRKIKTALAYPCFIVIFTIVLSYSLIAFIMPGFIPIFKTTGIDVSRDYPLTSMLITGSEVARNLWVVGPVLLALIAITIFVSIFGSKNSTGRYIVDYVKYNIPFLNSIVHLSIYSKFCRSFAVLSKSGVTLMKVLELVSEGAENSVVSKAVDKISLRIREGEKMSVAMKQTKIFPDLVIQMVSIGEEAGTLPDMLERIAEYYEEEMEASIDTMTSLLEPIMMIVVGIIVALFILGILLPILGIATRFAG